MPDPSTDTKHVKMAAQWVTVAQWRYKLLSLRLLKRRLRRRLRYTQSGQPVAAKMASLFALVVKLRPSAKRTMKPSTMPSRASLSCTKYNASIEPMSKVAAMSVLQALTIHVRERSSK